MRVLVTGASGTIGRVLSRTLLARGDSVIGVSRQPDAQPAIGIEWTDWSALAVAVERADAVVHLAGADVAAKRWSAARKRTLRESRIDTARKLVHAIRSTARAPQVLVSASAVGYYGPRDAELVDESTPPGSGFLATLCRDWEEVAAGSGVRTVLLRLGLVLAPDSGAFPKLRPPFKLFLGGPVGRGRQGFAWVHIDDAVGAILFAIDSGTVEGPLNVVAPEPISSAEFSRALGRALRRPALLPVPPFLLRLRLGEGASVLTTGQRVLPQRAEAAGYQFRYRDIDHALADLVR